MLTKGRYVELCVQHLSKVSRAAQGKVDTSSSQAKEGIIAESDPEALKAKVANNFARTIDGLFDNRNRSFASADEVKAFLRQMWADIHKDLLGEKKPVGSTGGVGDDDAEESKAADASHSHLRDYEVSKYAYSPVSPVPSNSIGLQELGPAFDSFCELLYEVLNNPDKYDPISVAAWVIYRVNLTDHYFKDGCGKTSVAIAWFVFMRYGVDEESLPKFATNTAEMDEHDGVMKWTDLLKGYAPRKVRLVQHPYEDPQFKFWLRGYLKLFWAVPGITLRWASSDDSVKTYEVTVEKATQRAWVKHNSDVVETIHDRSRVSNVDRLQWIQGAFGIKEVHDVLLFYPEVAVLHECIVQLLVGFKDESLHSSEQINLTEPVAKFVTLNADAISSLHGEFESEREVLLTKVRAVWSTPKLGVVPAGASEEEKELFKISFRVQEYYSLYAGRLDSMSWPTEMVQAFFKDVAGDDSGPSIFVECVTDLIFRDRHLAKMQEFVADHLPDVVGAHSLSPLEAHESAHRVSTMIVGGPAAGKSSMMKAHPRSDTFDRASVLLDPDKFKVLLLATDSLPATLQQFHAKIVHEESSFVSGMARDRILAQLQVRPAQPVPNVVFDSVSPSEQRLRVAQEGGGTLVLMVATCPIEEAICRAYARGEKTGRFVPPSIIIGGHKKLSQRLPGTLCSTSSFLELFDTDVVPGTPPQLIAEIGTYSRVSLVIWNLGRMLDFVKKALANVKASSPSELYRQADLTPEARVRELMRYVEFGMRISMRLANGVSQEYAKLSKEDGLVITNIQLFIQALATSRLDVAAVINAFVTYSSDDIRSLRVAIHARDKSIVFLAEDRFPQFRHPGWKALPELTASYNQIALIYRLISLSRLTTQWPMRGPLGDFLNSITRSLPTVGRFVNRLADRFLVVDKSARAAAGSAVSIRRMKERQAEELSRKLAEILRLILLSRFDSASGASSKYVAMVDEFEGGLRPATPDESSIDRLLESAGASASDTANKEAYWSMLHDAVTRGNPYVVSVLIKYAAIPVNIRNATGETPLYIACYYNHRKAALRLIASGADINTTGATGRKVLFWVIYHSMFEVMSEMVRLGVDLDNIYGDFNVFHVLAYLEGGMIRRSNLVLSDGQKQVQTMFNLALSTYLPKSDEEDPAVIEAMRVSRVSQLNKQSEPHGFTPLHMSVDHNSQACVNSLLARGGEVELNALDKNGRTPRDLVGQGYGFFVASEDLQPAPPPGMRPAGTPERRLTKQASAGALRRGGR